MSEAARALKQALALAALSVVVAAAVHVPLVKRFARGEFRESFFEAAAYPGIRMITVEEAEELWRTGAAAVLDARAEEPFLQGHIPGARSLPAAEAGGELPGWVLEGPKPATIVVYCEGGDCRSSLALAKRLHDAGFGDVRVFEGGWAAWTAAGLPAEEGRGQAPEGTGGQ